MVRFEFVNATQADKGSHTQKSGAIQAIRSHVASFGHAKRGTPATVDTRLARHRVEKRSKTPRAAQSRPRPPSPPSSSQADSPEKATPSSPFVEIDTSSKTTLCLESKSAYTLFKSPTQNALDAFLRLPVELSVGECHRLQYCKFPSFQAVKKYLTGVRPDDWVYP